MKILLTIICCTLTLAGFNQEERKVLLIGIDGCRWDALQVASTPNIDALIGNATYSYDARTQFPTSSGPGWSSMLTGVWSPKHGVIDNSFAGENYDEFPHVFELIKSAQPDRHLSSVCHWGPINDNIVSSADFSVNVNSMADAESQGVAQLSNPELDMLFVHFDDVDIAGHAFGYSTDVPEYTQAIETTDGHIGGLLGAIQGRPNYANEEWLIAISTDHGGLGFGHGGASLDERRIFVIFSGDNFPNQELENNYTDSPSDASNGLNLNQSNVYGTLDHPVYTFGEGQDFTIEMRLKSNGWTGDPSIISDKDWNSGYNPGFVLALQTDLQTWKFNLGDGTERIDLEGGVVNDGEWHHIAVTVDRDAITKLFQDGEINGATTQILEGSIVSGFPVGVGQDGTLTYSSDFDGWIDELRIWQVAVEEDVLHSWACEDLATSHPNYDDLIGYWKMEEIADLHIDGTDPNNQVDLWLENGPYISSEDPMVCVSAADPIPQMVDITPTILTHLCVEIDPAWELDGMPLGISFADCGMSIIYEKGDMPHLFPNPVSQDGMLYCKDCGSGLIEIFSMQGQLVEQQQITFGDGVHMELPAGNYLVRFNSNFREAFSSLITVE